MNITELAIYKKMFGGGTSGATAYTVSSIDELPTNAVDGSMAIVEREIPDSVVGMWRFNDVITVFNTYFNVYYQLNGFEGGYYSVISGNGNSLYNSRTQDPKNLIYDVNSGWADESFKTLYIESEDSVTDEFYHWLMENATKLGGRVYGYWKFNDIISFEGINFSIFFSSSNQIGSLSLYETIYDEEGGLIYEGSLDTVLAYEEGIWFSDRYKTINVKGGYMVNDFYYWLIENATETEIPLLYIRENGEWVYKCEVA